MNDKGEHFFSNQLQDLFRQTFWILENFCEIQPKDDWKYKFPGHWDNAKRGIRSKVIRLIDDLDFKNIPLPTSEEERFEF